MKFSLGKIRIALLMVLFYVLMDFIYERVVFDYYSLGFRYEFDWSRYVTAKIIFLALLGFILLKFEAFLFSFFSLFVSLFLVPNLVLYQFMPTPAFIVAGIALIPVLTYFLNRYLPGIKAPMLNQKQRTFLIIGASLALLVPFLIAYGAPRSLKALSLDVYALREQSAESGNLFTRYFYSWLSYWMLPICMIIGFQKKNGAIFLLGFAGLLYLFLVTGNKVTLFVTFAVIGFLLFKQYYKKVTYFFLAILTLCLAVLVFPEAQLPYAASDLLIRRFMFLPALLNYQYTELFREPLYLSHSIFSQFIEYPYQFPPPRMIGLHFYESSDANMTNGVISDGYINFGIVGVFFISILVSAVITFFSKMNLKPVYFGLFFLLIQNFIDNAFSTSLVTHGLLLFMAVALFILKEPEP